MNLPIGYMEYYLLGVSVRVAKHVLSAFTTMHSQDCSVLLSLPPELRIHIFELHLPDSLATFGDTLRPPTLLQVSRQVQQEFAGIFYGSDCLKLDAYYSSTDSWCPLAEARAKRAVLENQKIELKDLADFWSLASARRHCQRVGGNRQRGIMTVMTSAGFRRWMWSEKT
jgi:hypothetical protein